jgi:hypothetical protein
LRLSSNPNPVGSQAYNRQAQAVLRFDVMDRLAGVKALTLCIIGEQDLITPVHECCEVESVKRSGVGTSHI